MEQGLGDNIRFREVDQDGRPVDPTETLTAGQAVAPDGPSRTTVNPYIVALWSVGAVLMVGGVWAFTNAALLLGPSSGPLPVAYMVLNFAPWAVLAGLLDALALLFWHAVQWQRKRR